MCLNATANKVVEQIVHLHDYDRLYEVPGLYEHIVQQLLCCRSPQVAAGGLALALGRLELDPADLAVLDVGAGAGLVSAGALGGTHVPATALIQAIELLPPGAPVVFTIDARWMRTDGPGGFRAPVARLLASGRLRLLERSCFRHRLTTAGEPIHYELVIAAGG